MSRNLDKQTTSFALTDKTQISVQETSGSPLLVSSTPQNFPTLYNNPNLFLNSFIFRFTAAGAGNDEILSMEQQYTP